jgi:hypothetical protein
MSAVKKIPVVHIANNQDECRLAYNNNMNECHF